MKTTAKCLATVAVLGSSLASPAFPARLELAFLPPDFPPTDICRAPQETLGEDEVQVTEGAGSEEDPDLWIRFLDRDIRNLSRADAEANFAFIQQLIAFKAELDPEYAGVDETLARIDLYIEAGRFDDLEDAGLVETLAAQADQLTQSQRVRLARYFLTGLGVTMDRARGEAMLTDEAYSGNANALLELLRLQLAGVELADWFEPPERTATLALGGKLGQLNRGICNRAESIAREYIDGEFLLPNADLAFAWRKFAADQGGVKAAWRVVEHMLSEHSTVADDELLLHYLRLATGPTYFLDASDVASIRAAGATRAETIEPLLANLHGHTAIGTRQSAVPLFELSLNSEERGLAEDSPHLAYLRHITGFAGVPGDVWTRLADEILLRVGRWKGEADAIEALEHAVDAGDPAAHVRLARMRLRQGVEAGDTTPALELLTDAVDRFGYAPAMRELNGYYRCTAHSAPLAEQADFWGTSWNASRDVGFNADARNIVTLSGSIAPESVARLQRHALLGRTTELAGFLQRMEAGPVVSEDALRHWAVRVGQSKKALELFALGTYELARDPRAAANAADFVRRAYLTVGAGMSLDLAVILTRHDARTPERADEIRRLLREAGTRGEGAAIRLLHRLEGARDDRIYRQFAEAIENRGDFLALMFASAFVDDATFDDYMARAVAELRCGTKDVSEIADAYAGRGRTAEALHWLEVGLAVEGGHSMSRLGTTRYEMERFDRKPVEIAMPEGAARDPEIKEAYRRIAQPRSETFDRSRAAALLAQGLQSEDSDILAWAFSEYARAEAGIKRVLEATLDMSSIFALPAEAGVVDAQYAYGMYLRSVARSAADLEESAAWLHVAAKAGHAPAMTDYGYALAHGIGVLKDPRLALIWLRKAETLIEPRAPALVSLVEAMEGEGW